MAQFFVSAIGTSDVALKHLFGYELERYSEFNILFHPLLSKMCLIEKKESKLIKIQH